MMDLTGMKSFLAARNSLRKKETWLAGSMVAMVILGILFVPGGLARSVRLDPISQAELHISQREYREALAVLRGMPLKEMDGWAVRKVGLQRAICYKGLGLSREALVGFRRLAGTARDLEDYIAFWKAECYEALDRPDSAAVHYARILDQEIPSRLKDEAVLRAAAIYMSGGQMQNAAGLYRRLLNISGEELGALNGLAEALKAMGDSAEARDVQLRLVRDYPEAPEALSVLKDIGDLKGESELFLAGMANARNGQTRRAIRLFRSIVRKGSDTTWRGRAQYELASVYYDRKDYRTAERAFQKAYKTYKVPKALFDLGRCSVRFGRDLKAAKQFEDFAALYPSVNGAAKALWNAAMAYERRRKPKQAREVFLRLAALYPKSDFADKGLWRAGFVLYKMGKYEEAARTFVRLSTNTTENYLRDQGYYWAGKCSASAGNKEEADTLFRKAAKGFPASYYSSRARAVMGLATEVYPDVPMDEKVMSRDVYRPSSFLLKGDLLADLGQYESARREYQRVARSNADDLFALGDLLHRLERIGAMNQALQVSYMMVTAEQERGVPMTLASFRRMYPTYYWGEINRTAQEMDLDPNLILAIIRQESAFNEEAVSRAGARGLMQVMPKTGSSLARKLRVKGFSADDLWEAQTSIRFGSQHLADHLRYFKRSKDRSLGLALSAYNAGLKAARRWSRRLTSKDVDEFVESIPYRETRNYVKLVYRNYQVYSYLQKGNGDVRDVLDGDGALLGRGGS
jgi:soluble lytic murein transglycosylase